MTSRIQRSRAGRIVMLASLIVSAMLLVATSATPSPAKRQRTARAARTLRGDDTAHLHLLHLAHNGERLLEEGSATGTLPGQMRAELDIGSVYTGSFTIYTRNGRIRGNGRANPHGSGRYQSFAGSLTITGGTGLYTHVHGDAELYGVFDRRSYAIIVQTKTTGTASY